MTRNALPHPGTATSRRNHIPGQSHPRMAVLSCSDCHTVSPPRWCWGCRSCARETKLSVTLCFLREATMFCQLRKYLNTEPTLLTWGSTGKDANPHGAPHSPAASSHLSSALLPAAQLPFVLLHGQCWSCCLCAISLCEVSELHQRCSYQ